MIEETQAAATEEAEDSAASPRVGVRASALGVVQKLTRVGRLLFGAVREIAGSMLGATSRIVRQDLSGAFGHLAKSRFLGVALLGSLILLYLSTGAYVVSPGEVAVVTRFGRVVQPRVTSGLRWHMPWPVEFAQTVNVSQVRREGIGVSLPDHPVELHPPEEIQLLTGDENLLGAKAIVQYRVKDPADYLFRVDFNEDPLLRVVVKAAMTDLAGAMQVDSLLTSGRTEFQVRLRERVQHMLDGYQSGLEIVSIDLQEIVPPGEVAQAFRDVASAAEEKNKLINDARGYANSIVPQARGEADRRVREGEGYKTDVVNRAGGEAQRFTDVLAQYRNDAQVFGPGVTRYRLYIETMERVLPKAKKYVVDPTQGGQVNIRILDQLPVAPPEIP